MYDNIGHGLWHSLGLPWFTTLNACCIPWWSSRSSIFQYLSRCNAPSMATCTRPKSQWPMHLLRIIIPTTRLDVMLRASSNQYTVQYSLPH
jgi:hypothetical protein